MHTTISSPSIVGTVTLFDRWKAIGGNENKTIDEFYAFVSSRSLFRDWFLSENATGSFHYVKENIVLFTQTAN